MAQVALAWTLARPGVSSVIVGARTEAQLRDNLGAANITLTEEEGRRLDLASALPPEYPAWQLARMANDRLPGAVSVQSD
jgi:aryl-alcohol dehydrogenase-like predicted oxidoreductase